MIALAWTFARKDLTLYLRDRTALALSILLPLFLAGIFGAAMGSFGGKNTIGKVRILVEDLDGTPRSKELVQLLTATEGLRVQVETDVRKRVANGKAPAALVVPSGYGADLDAGRGMRLKLYRDPAQEIEQQIIAGNLLPVLFRAGGSKLSRDVVKRGMSELGLSVDAIPGFDAAFDSTWELMQGLAETAQSNGGSVEATGSTTAAKEDASADPDFLTRLPNFLGLEVEDVAGGEDQDNRRAGKSHAVSGIGVMMLLFGLVAAGGSILEERAQGTLTRLLLTPASSASVLLGKFLFTFLSGMLQLVILFAFGTLVFDVPVWRDPLAVLVVSASVCAAATSLGLFLAVSCNSRKQLEGLSTLIILVMSALGGSWFPLAITPEWYRTLGHFTLNAWAMDAYQGLFWYQKGLGGVWLEVLVLLAIAGTMAALAARGWHRRFATNA
ncbi:MAG: ABC transporter permease [Planctomycetes bacterium]|nr:ABC transporter permease [Planctomycetota bacterium]